MPRTAEGSPSFVVAASVSRRCAVHLISPLSVTQITNVAYLLVTLLKRNDTSCELRVFQGFFFQGVALSKHRWQLGCCENRTDRNPREVRNIMQNLFCTDTEGRFGTMSTATIELDWELDSRVTDADLLGSIGYAVDSPTTLPANLRVEPIGRSHSGR